MTVATVYVNINKDISYIFPYESFKDAEDFYDKAMLSMDMGKPFEVAAVGACLKKHINGTAVTSLTLTDRGVRE
ncbi:MAG: hypothetical protein IJT54_01855 [Candidatus Methanomethylophilaceae archaeon]|nr:hypothetical protein [Candidatus Methanomethylophilaceae archaeon]